MNQPDLIASLQNVGVRHRVRRHSSTVGALMGAASAIGGRITQKGRHVYVDSLRDINLELKPGDRVGLVGSNGSGKTTLLSVLGGLLPPTAGEATVWGTVVPILNIHSGFNPLLTGRENVLVKALYMDLDPADRKAIVEDAFEFSGIGSYFDLPLKSYSAGMRVRLALSVATMHKPDLLLMDEWINAGDEQFRTESQRRLEGLVSGSGAMMLASHAYPVLKEWVDDVIWLRNGEIVESGKLEPVWKAYRKWQIGQEQKQ